MKRLFIALELPDDVKAGLAELQRALRPYFEEATWVRPEGLHLTLKFLGETPEDRIPAIRDVCERAVQALPAFSLELRGVGAFPDWRCPRVLWVGAHSTGDTLVTLRSAVERAVEPLGYPREARPFVPHLTLARIKQARSTVVQRLLERERGLLDRGYGTVPVQRVTLFESRLHPQGAIYTVLTHFPLA